MDLSTRFLAFTLGGAGWVLWLLVGLSVVSLAIMLERFWYLRRHQPDRAALVADMHRLLDSHHAHHGHLEQATKLDPDRLAAAVDGAKARERHRLERNLSYLATLGS